jgi:hypothetical protein
MPFRGSLLGGIAAARGLLILIDAWAGGVQLVVIGTGRPRASSFLYSSPNLRSERGYTHNDLSSVEAATY